MGGLIAIFRRLKCKKTRVYKYIYCFKKIIRDQLVVTIWQTLIRPLSLSFSFLLTPRYLSFLYLFLPPFEPPGSNTHVSPLAKMHRPFGLSSHQQLTPRNPIVDDHRCTSNCWSKFWLPKHWTTSSPPFVHETGRATHCWN